MNTTRKILLGSTLAAFAALTPAFASEPAVGEIDVTIDLAQVEGSNALEYYPTLETDLESKLAEKLAPMLASDGGRMMVFIKEVSVDGNAILVDTGAFNTLSGAIQFFPPSQDPTDGASPLSPVTTDVSVVAVPDYVGTATAGEGPIFFTLPSDGVVYDVMIDKFADIVAERLTEM